MPAVFHIDHDTEPEGAPAADEADPPEHAADEVEAHALAAFGRHIAPAHCPGPVPQYRSATSRARFPHPQQTHPFTPFPPPATGSAITTLVPAQAPRSPPAAAAIH